MFSILFCNSIFQKNVLFSELQTIQHIIENQEPTISAHLEMQ